MARSTHIVQALRHNVRRLKALRDEISLSRPDAIISFDDRMNIMVLLASVGLGIPVIISQRVEPEHPGIPTVWRQLRHLLYRKASALVVQSQTVASWAKGLVHAERVHIIPNPAIISLNRAQNAPRLHHGIVAMGRLDHVKGFDLLIDAFALFAARHCDWRLIILGDGEERNQLEALTARLDLKNQVEFRGSLRDPSEVLREAELFVVPSRCEGFPNALLEAMACGLPVISTDCAGPREIIRDGIDGILVPRNDPHALAAAMERLIDDPLTRMCLAKHAMEVTERFSLEGVMAMWEDLLIRTLLLRPQPRESPR